MFLGLLIIFVEVALVTALNYMAIDTYVSLDVLYCLPIIQAARFQAVHAQRQSELLLPLIIGFLVGAIWSLAEALVTVSDFPMDALVLNIFTRASRSPCWAKSSRVCGRTGNTGIRII